MDVNLMQLPGIVAISILGTGLSTLFFLVALKMIGTVRANHFLFNDGMFGVLFSGAFLAESITMLDGISLALVIGGIYLLRKKIAASEGHEEEISEVSPKAKPNNGKSKKRRKFTPKISFRKRVEDGVISKVG